MASPSKSPPGSIPIPPDSFTSKIPSLSSSKSSMSEIPSSSKSSGSGPNSQPKPSFCPEGFARSILTATFEAGLITLEIL